MFDLLNEKSDNTNDETDDDEEFTEEKKRESLSDLKVCSKSHTPDNFLSGVCDC